MKKTLFCKFNYFTAGEYCLWGLSVLFIVLSYVLFDRSNHLALIASLIGATSLIFCAKGNPFGQFLMIIFGAIYTVISYSFSYYGEMITYLGMTTPMSVVAFVSWMKNPYRGKKSEVTVNSIGKKEAVFMVLLAIAVTVIFYFILAAFNTANLITSTISITTSFLAVYLTSRRSPYFALMYAANDVVLIILWLLATIENVSYLSVVVCFIAFLVNDIYGYISWNRMKERQAKDM